MALPRSGSAAVLSRVCGPRCYGFAYYVRYEVVVLLCQVSTWRALFSMAAVAAYRQRTWAGQRKIASQSLLPTMVCPAIQVGSGEELPEAARVLVGRVSGVVIELRRSVI